MHVLSSRLLDLAASPGCALINKTCDTFVAWFLPGFSQMALRCMCKTLQTRSLVAALAYQMSIRIHIKTRVVIITLETRNSGKVHTSAMARLTSVAISILPSGKSVRDDESGSGSRSPPKLVSHQPSMKISCKSVRTFLRKVANTQTKRQRMKERRKHILLGGGNEYSTKTQIYKTNIN